MQEHRIYLDGKLVNICYSNFALMCNYSNYKHKYGNRVTTKVVDSNDDIKEKEEWLNNLFNDLMT